MFQAIEKPPIRERRGVPAEQPVRIAHVVSVVGSHAVAILERSSEPTLQAKDPRIQIGSVVKILTPGASVVGLVLLLVSCADARHGWAKRMRSA